MVTLQSVHVGPAGAVHTEDHSRPHTELEWHSHPMPSAAYIVGGELTLERKKDGKKQRFTAGHAVSETVDTCHRGVAGNEPVVLIVFYAGSPGMPLSGHSCR